MALYINEIYYQDNFGGTLIPENDIDKYLKLAQQKIDEVTYNRIVKIGFDNLTEFQRDNIKEAICYQAEYIFENGYNDENNKNLSSYSVLDINISVDTLNKSKASKKSMSEIAYSKIRSTGLDSPIL